MSCLVWYKWVWKTQEKEKLFPQEGQSFLWMHWKPGAEKSQPASCDLSMRQAESQESLLSVLAWALVSREGHPDAQRTVCSCCIDGWWRMVRNDFETTTEKASNDKGTSHQIQRAGAQEVRVAAKEVVKRNAVLTGAPENGKELSWDLGCQQRHYSRRYQLRSTICFSLTDHLSSFLCL